LLGNAVRDAVGDVGDVVRRCCQEMLLGDVVW